LLKKRGHIPLPVEAPSDAVSKSTQLAFSVELLEPTYGFADLSSSMFWGKGNVYAVRGFSTSTATCHVSHLQS
jgi:hypothetical protein